MHLSVPPIDLSHTKVCLYYLPICYAYINESFCTDQDRERSLLFDQYKISFMT